MLRDLIAAAERIEAEGVFLGGPKNAFARVGRNQLIAAVDQGLTPDARVLDIGCGCLRGGWWLINFLRPERYFGLEPNRAMLEAGIAHLLDDRLLAEKRPRFDHNDAFDFEAFGVAFDFMIARSIWTHAAPGQIERMLDQFARAAAPDGVLLASYREAGEEPQYDGREWVGRSHDSDTPGMVAYRIDWIRGRCRLRGLSASRLYADYGQIWLRIHRRGEASGLENEPRNARLRGFGQGPGAGGGASPPAPSIA